MSNYVVDVEDLKFININGHRVVQAYERDFIEIFHHNIKYQTLFSDFNEVNYSTKRNKLSFLCFADEEFLVPDTNAYEFLLIYTEVNVVIHWKQEKSIHRNITNVGYTPLHVKSTIQYFGGLALSSHSQAYIDGQPYNDDWWYAIGQKEYYNYKYIPGPYNPIATSLFDVSLFIRLTNISQIQRFPILLFASVHQIVRVHLSYSYFLIFVLLK